MDYSERIKSIRDKLFLSQENLAKELNVSTSTVNRWEMKHSIPNIKARKSLNDLY